MVVKLPLMNQIPYCFLIEETGAYFSRKGRRLTADNAASLIRLGNATAGTPGRTQNLQFAHTVMAEAIFLIDSNAAGGTKGRKQQSQHLV